MKAQLGVLLPAGLCRVPEAAIRTAGAAVGPRFWHNSLELIGINAGGGLMIGSGLLRGYLRRP